MTFATADSVYETNFLKMGTTLNNSKSQIKPSQPGLKLINLFLLYFLLQASLRGILPRQSVVILMCTAVDRYISVRYPRVNEKCYTNKV